MNKSMSSANWFSVLLKITLAAVCAVFVGSESLAFFEFIFPPEKWYLSYTGFGLTMGAFLVYLFLLLKDAKTSLQKVIALLMMVAGLVFELATAGFGMMIEGWTKLGWQPSASEYDFMILAIRIAMGIHGVSLVLYSFGDRIVELMKDQDGDGVPNFLDEDYKPEKNPAQNKGSVFSRWFGRSTQPAATTQKALDVGQTHIDIDGLTNEQHMQLAKLMVEMKAKNDLELAKAGGNGRVDPTQAAR